MNRSSNIPLYVKKLIQTEEKRKFFLLEQSTQSNVITNLKNNPIETLALDRPSFCFVKSAISKFNAYSVPVTNVDTSKEHFVFLFDTLPMDRVGVALT